MVAAPGPAILAISVVFSAVFDDFGPVFASLGAGERFWDRFSIFSDTLHYSCRRNKVFGEVLRGLARGLWRGPGPGNFAPGTALAGPGPESYQMSSFTEIKISRRLFICTAKHS